jgi:transcription-repair coupling factor (superfamily II helicase)
MESPFDHIVSSLKRGAPNTVVTGAHGAVASLVVARVLAADLPARPLVVVCADEARAIQVADELDVLWRPVAPPSGDPLMPPRTLLLPEVEVSPYSDLVPDRRTILRRQAVLFRLLQELTGPVVVLSVRSLMRRAVPADVFDSLCELVVSGEEIDRDDLAETLVRAGYQSLPVVEDEGSFTVRGGVVDIFPPIYRYPVRLELEGDVVSAIRLYDPQTQRTLREIEAVYLHPVRETVVTAGAHPRERLLEAADAASHPSARTRFILGQIEEGADFFGSESLVSIFHRRMVPLWDYMPESALWVLEEPAALVREARAAADGYAAAYQERLENHQLALPPAEIFLEPGELEEHLDTVAHRLSFESLASVDQESLESPESPESPESGEKGHPVELRSESHVALVHAVRRLQADRGQEVLSPLAEELGQCLERGQPTLVVSPDERASTRLGSLLAQHGVRTTVCFPTEGYDLPGADGVAASSPAEDASVELRLGHLSHGFTLMGGPAIFAEEELFGRKVRRSPRRGRDLPRLGDLSELTEGDFVVHQAHGVGRYDGLRREEVRGVAGDFMLLSYQGEARLYLPVHRFKEVHRYVAAEGRPPRLDKLGGVTWQRNRSKASESIRRLAEELLKLYAQREALPGHACAPPDDLYGAFEATFPFVETPDQRNAIEAVLEDMASPQPMDRLVCGDVGYGKTEVALRAAVLAVLDGRQVVLLAPTTVLVEQHLATFRERLRNFPVRVDGLSRFRSKASQKRTLAALADGGVDVVIGTHRLLSKDVRLARLGLIIVDEEQRFGVAHKERLKQLRTQVDVLTLTATPIPRTLHMSLLGLRDLSLIATPPTDRQAIRTYVTATSTQVVRDAVRRELARGGQVFFVLPYISGPPVVTATTAPETGGVRGRKKRLPPPPRDPSRLGSLAWWADEIRGLVPEARVAEAHGRLEDRSLERVMAEFVAGHHDVLVCTSIVESGLDISRANSMVVADADRFGLAQLYQLRGRIGRGKVRAFCLLMVPSMSAITPEARQRLEALQRFSDLGAGFQLATTDLEIRGTGDLLGAKQSGSIAAVGFEEYTRIMSECVAELRGEPLESELDPDLVSDVSSYIPDDYVSEAGQRLHYYRRLADVVGESDAEAVVAEMADRFGAPPPEVQLLADLMVLKGLGRQLQARGVELTGSRLTLVLDESTPLSPAWIRDLVLAQPRRYTFTPDFKLMHRLRATEDNHRLSEAKKSLHHLLASVRESTH